MSKISLVENYVCRSCYDSNTGEPLFRLAKHGAHRERSVASDEHFQFESDS